MKPLMFLTVFLVGALAMPALVESAQPAKQAGQSSVRAQRPPRKVQGETPKPILVDGDQAYKANCLRCHWEPRKFSEREMVTIMRHMRVRANLTSEETEAILKYLTR
jgi:hypothetical protein